jgi:hypothetical protein
LLLAAGCAGGSDLSHRDPTVLDRDFAGRVAGESERCVPARRSGGLEVAGGQTLIYRSGDTIWVNRLANRCPGLHPVSNLMVEMNGPKYCRGDRLRVTEPQADVAGAMCVLGDFVPYRRQDG